MGFKIELRKLWSDISAILKNKKQRIWICGHSLGGAMATLCASRLEELGTLFTHMVQELVVVNGEMVVM